MNFGGPISPACAMPCIHCSLFMHHIWSDAPFQASHTPVAHSAASQPCAAPKIFASHHTDLRHTPPTWNQNCATAAGQACLWMRMHPELLQWGPPQPCAEEKPPPVQQGSPHAQAPFASATKAGNNVSTTCAGYNKSPPLFSQDLHSHRLLSHLQQSSG